MSYDDIDGSARCLLNILQRDADGCAMRILDTPPGGRDNMHFAFTVIRDALRDVARCAAAQAVDDYLADEVST